MIQLLLKAVLLVHCPTVISVLNPTAMALNVKLAKTLSGLIALQLVVLLSTTAV